jgi:hypothetical protein
MKEDVNRPVFLSVCLADMYQIDSSKNIRNDYKVFVEAVKREAVGSIPELRRDWGIDKDSYMEEVRIGMELLSGVETVLSVEVFCFCGNVEPTLRL